MYALFPVINGIFPDAHSHIAFFQPFIHFLVYHFLHIISIPYINIFTSYFDFLYVKIGCDKTGKKMMRPQQTHLKYCYFFRKSAGVSPITLLNTL